MPKTEGRPARWAKAVSDARDACDRLYELQAEYGEWQQNLPEAFEGSPTGEKLDAVNDLDLRDLDNCLDELEAVDLPRGFGRD